MKAVETKIIDELMEIEKYIFSKEFPDFGTIRLRPLELTQDIDTIYSWVTKPYAKYWGMQYNNKVEVQGAYQTLANSDHHKVFMGTYQNEVVFLMEFYEVSRDRIASYYDVKNGDYGMHLLVAPINKRIPNFTWNVFTTVLDYFFSQEVVKRIVVEPDVTNAKIHKLNKKAGFCYEKEVDLPEKRAALAFCKRADYVMAKYKVMTLKKD